MKIVTNDQRILDCISCNRSKYTKNCRSVGCDLKECSYEPIAEKMIDEEWKEFIAGIAKNVRKINRRPVDYLI